MICKNCGIEFDDELKACPECETPVEETEEIVKETEVVEEAEVVEETESVEDAEVVEESVDEETEEDDDDDEKADENTGKIGLIIAIIAVVLVIAIGSVIFIASKKDYSGTSSLEKFFFSLKSDDSKRFLDGIWQIDESDNYYKFDGDKLEVYNKSILQDELTVKYISKNEVQLTSVEDDGSLFTMSMKPIINSEKKTLEMQLYYQKIEVAKDAMDQSKMNFSMVEKLPDPFTIEQKMSDKEKSSLQGTWKGTQGLSGSDEKADTELTINGDKITWESNEWEAVYANDGELVLKMYSEYYGGDVYIGFNYTLKGDTLKMTMAYQVMSEEKTEIEKENQTILTLKKQK